MKKGTLKQHGLILVLLLCMTCFWKYYSKGLPGEDAMGASIVEGIPLWITIAIGIAFFVEVVQYYILYRGQLVKRKGTLKQHGLILALLLCVTFLWINYSKGQPRGDAGGGSMVTAILLDITIIIGIVFIVEIFQYSVLYCGQLAERKGFPKSCKWFGLLLIIGIVILMWATPPEKQNSKAGSDAEEIMKYMELYKQGAITKEEFVKKKTELLNKDV